MAPVSARPLRVLHVFGRLLRGGAELRTIELVEACAGPRVQCDFLVLSGLDGPLDDRVRAAGGEVLKCRLDRRFPSAFLRVLRERRYDVVHSHVHYFSGVVLGLARIAGVPGRIAHFRSAVANDRPDTWRRRLQLAVCRRLVHQTATDILAVGEGAMSAAWSPRWKADPRCRVVYNAIPPARLCDLPAALPVPTLINVASVQPLKNQLRLIGMLGVLVRQVPAVQLLIVGREIGDYGDRIRRAAMEAGLAPRVHLLGEVDDAMPLIAGSSLLVLPSLWEGLPGAALEACAAGVPVLASDLPGTRELASHFPRMTVLPLAESDAAWAAAALRLLEVAREPSGEAAATFAASAFSMARARQAHLEIWSRNRAS